MCRHIGSASSKRLVAAVPAVPDGRFSAGLVGHHQICWCITSIKVFAKCLTTANIPLSPACPINVLAFATALKKQLPCCLTPIRSGEGNISAKRNQFSSHTDCFITNTFTHDFVCFSFLINSPLCQAAQGRWQWWYNHSLHQCRTFWRMGCLVTAWRYYSEAQRYLCLGHPRQKLWLPSPWFLEKTMERCGWAYSQVEVSFWQYKAWWQDTLFSIFFHVIQLSQFIKWILWSFKHACVFLVCLKFWWIVAAGVLKALTVTQKVSLSCGNVFFPLLALTAWHSLAGNGSKNGNPAQCNWAEIEGDLWCVLNTQYVSPSAVMRSRHTALPGSTMHHCVHIRAYYALFFLQKSSGFTIILI